MADRSDIFAGDDPFAIARGWLDSAMKAEMNDANAMALSTVDSDGLPNVRMVLLKEIEDNAFVFYTNYNSKKGQELAASGKAAFVIHWKSLRRQIRVRGTVGREEGLQADAYYESRSLKSRIGAWASKQSEPLNSREVLMAEAEMMGVTHGSEPKRPPFWGGFRIFPKEIEFWADGEYRLHNRFRWSRSGAEGDWDVQRLYP